VAAGTYNVPLSYLALYREVCDTHLGWNEAVGSSLTLPYDHQKVSGESRTRFRPEVISNHSIQRRVDATSRKVAGSIPDQVIGFFN
jgi:hypothetical protein